MAWLTEQSLLPSFLRRENYLPLQVEDGESSSAIKVKPNFSQILRSKRGRALSALCLALVLLAIIYFSQAAHGYRFSTDYINWRAGSSKPSSSSTQSPECADGAGIDWTRFAYTQYVTDGNYLCNSVMLFEILHRLGSKADRLMMYPSHMTPTDSSTSRESLLLLKAQREYNVKLQPIEVQHRSGGEPDQTATWADSYTKLLAFNQTQYARVLSLDSDSTILQPMDELFLLPPVPLAMPRAYWLPPTTLSSQLLLITPSPHEFARIQTAISTAPSNDFDMEIVNQLYGQDCLILPHRKYDLITGELRSEGSHERYLGNAYEKWDPEEAVREAKFLHFSDWPMPKPWLDAPEKTREEVEPKCVGEGGKDCRARRVWNGFYKDFKERMKRVCEISPSTSNPRDLPPIQPRHPHDFIPEQI